MMMKNVFPDRLDLDEIVFQNRNKAYGAYALRHEANHLLAKAVFFGSALIVAASTIPLLFNNIKSDTKITTDNVPPTILTNIPVEKEIIKVPAAVIPPKTVKTFDSTVPTPVATPAKEKPAATADDYKDAKAGFQTVEGPKTAEPYTPVVTPPAAPGPINTPVQAAPPADANAVPSAVDVEASFAGGINAFRNKVVSQFDTSAFEGSGDILKTTVVFIVERDGTISNVKATGADASFNKIAEQTVRSIKGKWTPAKLNGQNVRSYFRFPISMQFE